MPHQHDLEIDVSSVARLTSPEAVAAFLKELGYPAGQRQALSAAGLGLGESERQVKRLEVVSEDEYLRVVCAELRAVTAKNRSDLVRAFGKDTVRDHLLVLTSDFDTLEFVLIDKETRVQ